jgi:ketosteroid isomerase-like protein
MRLHAVTAGALVLLCSASSLHAQDPTAAQVADIERAVKEQVLQYYQTVDALDGNLHIRFWSREKIIGFASGGRLETSVDAMTEGWRRMAGNRKASTFDCQSIPVRVFSSDAAMAMCIGPLRIEMKDGTVNNYNFVGTSMWAKEAAGWKLIFVQETSATRQ